MENSNLCPVVTRYPIETKKRALELYLQGLPLAHIAQDTGVPYGTIHFWHSSQRWADIRKQLQARMIDHVTRDYEVFRVNAALVLMKQTVTTAHLLNEAIMTSLDEGGAQSLEILRMGRALVASVKAVEPFLNTRDGTSITSMEELSSGRH